MEGRMKKYQQGSPERAKVWTEKSLKYHQQQPSRKVAAVYYLCRNRQLEHPHFIEVSLTSRDGLYLRGGCYIHRNKVSSSYEEVYGPSSSSRSLLIATAFTFKL